MYFLVSGNAPSLYPIEIYFGIFHCIDGYTIEIPYKYPLIGEWGKELSNVFEEPKDYTLIKKLDLVYLSIVEQKFYSVEANIDGCKIEQQILQLKNFSIPYIILGIAPFGLCSIWVSNKNKSILNTVCLAKEITVDMQDFRPSTPLIKLNEICIRYINMFNIVKENLERNGLPPKNLFDKYMQQFTYRYLPIFEKWDNRKEEWQRYKDNENIPEFEYIEETLFDGTHDKLHDDGLLKYHEAGKPKKLAIKWHYVKTEYAAYIWFEDERICAVYDRFYGAHPDTKVDFIIHIDAEKKKYELALYRYGLKEPLIIPKDAYQMIVFKNKFEYYRTDNYNQPKGAWIW